MGNFSRDTFNPARAYSSVRLQQGVPIVDADWNEQDDLRRHELESFIARYAGDGVPIGNDGFRVKGDGSENDFIITGGDGTLSGAGRMLIGGREILSPGDIKFISQPLYNNATLAQAWQVAPLTPIAPPATGERVDCIYVECWDREVRYDEDSNLIHPELGIETCARFKREWVVRVAEGANQPPASGAGVVRVKIAELRRRAGVNAIAAADVIDARRVGLGILSKELSIRNGQVGISTTEPRTELDLGRGLLSGAPNDYMKAQFMLSGGGLVTWRNDRLKWNNRFIAIAMERGVNFGAGHVNIYMPNANIAAPDVFDSNLRSVDGDGLLLTDWDALFAVHTPGGGESAIRLQVVNYYSREFYAPSNWILVAVRNGDDGSIKLGTGVILAPNTSFTPGRVSPRAGNGPNDGLIFPADAFGGGGDLAWIKYYTRGGEEGTLEIGVANDAGDHIALMPTIGNVGVGTNNPQSKLHVDGGRVEITASGASGGGQNRFAGLIGPNQEGNRRAQLTLSSGYSDLVIASSQGNNIHGSTLSFVSYDPGNPNDYRKFVINQGNWGARKGFLEFGYAEKAAPNPHDYINDADTTLTLDGINKRLGIGTRYPQSSLHVAGNSLLAGDAQITGKIGVGAAPTASQLHVQGLATTSNGFVRDVRVLSPQSAAGWFRIAQSADAGGNNAGVFEIRWSAAGRHGHVRFSVGVNYGQAHNGNIQILGCSHYEGMILDRIRLVYAGTYDRMFVEFSFNGNYFDSYAIPFEIFFVSGYGWSLIDPTRIAAVPGGYATTEIRTDVQLATRNLRPGSPFAVDMNGQLGVGTANPQSKLHVDGGRVDITASDANGGGKSRFTGLIGPNQEDFRRAQLALSSGYSDLVIASSMGNDHHGSTLSFVSYNPGNPNDYRKFVINQGNWGARKGFLEFGYAEKAAPNPHEYINDTDTTLTLDGINKRAGIGTRTPRTALDTHRGTASGAINDYAKAQYGLSGGGQILWSGNRLSWTQRLIAISAERGVNFAVGYCDIESPTGAIPAESVHNGEPRSADGGVYLSGWEALYYAHTPGSANAYSIHNFRIVHFTREFSAPSNWIFIALVNGDDNTLKLGTGVTLANNSIFPRSSLDFDIELRGGAYESPEGVGPALFVGGRAMPMNQARGLNTTILRPNGSMKPGGQASHDVYGNPILWNAWADWVNAVAEPGDVVAVGTYDALQSAPLGGSAAVLLHSIRAAKAYYASGQGERSPYTLLFVKGQQACLEDLHPRLGPNARIRTTYLRACDAARPMHGGAAFTGMQRAPQWSVSTASGAYTILYDAPVIVPRDSVAYISVLGHWQVSTGWAYLRCSIAGTAIYNDGDYHATHTYATIWSPVGYSVAVDIAAGVHRIGVMMRTAGGTAWLNGSSITWMIVPK